MLQLAHKRVPNSNALDLLTAALPAVCVTPWCRRPTIRYFHIKRADTPIMLPPSKSPSSGFRWRALEIAIRLHGGSADGERATRLLAGAERARCAWAVRRLISQMGTSLQCRATFHKAVSVDRLSFSRRTAQSGKAPERPATGVASELCTSGRYARGRHDASSGSLGAMRPSGLERTFRRSCGTRHPTWSRTR